MESVSFESCLEDKEHEAIVRRIGQGLINGRKIIVVTGAGISVSSGIPDFRSAGGLYERLGLKFGGSGSTGTDSNNVTVKGKDFFDASFFHTEKTRPLFYKFIAELKEMCDVAEPTSTHAFLKELILEKRVMRWYTQNIDGLEEKVGLETSVTLSLTARSSEKPASPPVIGLHGTLAKLTCTICKTSVKYEQHEKLKAGESPECGTCRDRATQRAERGQRKIKSGILRPDIVLYNEPHPQGDQIAEHLSADLGKRPTMLLVIGTSLKVVGLKRMIKDVAKAVHANSPDGLVVYLNKTGIQAKSEWKSVFDYELVGECDRWVEILRSLKPTALSAATTTNVPEAPAEKEPVKPTEPPLKQETPVRPPAKTKKIDSFFKHVKSVVITTGNKAKPKIDAVLPNVAAPNVRSSARLRRVL